MAKRKTTVDPYAKRAGETDLIYRSRIVHLEQGQRDRSEPIVPDEAARHGNYIDKFVLHAETNTRAEVKLNRGGTPVERWIDSGRLSPTQLLAIALCERLWAMTGLLQRVTANYGEQIHGSAEENPRRMATLIDARQDLHRIIDYVPGAYWSVYENVCRHGEPAGVAGSRLGYGGRSANDRAHTVVCLVADIICMKEGLSY